MLSLVWRNHKFICGFMFMPLDKRNPKYLCIYSREKGAKSGYFVLYRSTFLPETSIATIVFVHSCKIPLLNSSLVIKLNNLHGEEIWSKFTWEEGPPVWWHLVLWPEVYIYTTVATLSTDPTISTVLSD